MVRQAIPWLALGLALWGCDGKEGAPDAPDAPDGDGDGDADTDADADTDTDTDVDIAEFGLDERPPNPSCIAPERPPGGSSAQLSRVFQGISHDEGTVLLMAPGDSSQWFLAERGGYVWRFANDPNVADKTLVMDLSGPVNAPTTPGSEMGLLGMAFHPDFQNNRQLFLYYSASGGGPNAHHESRVSRFTSTDGGLTFDPASEEILLRVDQPFSNHNGGTLLFGLDGHLYIGLGDGGSAGDPGGRAQDLDELLGKMLRIDVDGGTPYAIPADNPYANGGGRPEIYAVGLRNPFRFTLDPLSGELWAGDVGQYDWEEISKIERGGNYGWNIMEGYACYSPSQGCNQGGLAIPYAVYPNTFGASVVAGVVYYGQAIPSLRGTLLYSDFYAGDILGLFFDPQSGLPAPAEVVSNTGQQLVYYTADADGEVYLLDYDGEFYKLEPLPGEPADTFPRLLSQTGCFDAADPRQPLPGLVPYDIAHSFWSDGADKRRWMALPDGTSITVDDQGDWSLPVGTVLIKEFEHQGQRIETRLLMHHPDGTWGGYAYAWNDQQTEAELVKGGLVVDLPAQKWLVPDSGECNRCHTTVAGHTLGLETAQLNTLFLYESTGRTANQLATLEHIGLLSGVGDPASLPVYPAPDDTSADLETRARAYLHVNCAQCHQPDGPSRTDIDFRFDTALADMNICGVPPEHGELGLTDARVVAPGDPSRSVLSSRIRRRDAYQMPPIASAVVDEVGAQLIDDWISSLTGCP